MQRSGAETQKMAKRADGVSGCASPGPRGHHVTGTGQPGCSQHGLYHLMLHMVVSIHTAQKLGNSFMLGDWILILSFS